MVKPSLPPGSSTFDTARVYKPYPSSLKIKPYQNLGIEWKDRAVYRWLHLLRFTKKVIKQNSLPQYISHFQETAEELFGCVPENIQQSINRGDFMSGIAEVTKNECRSALLEAYESDATGEVAYQLALMEPIAEKKNEFLTIASEKGHKKAAFSLAESTPQFEDKYRFYLIAAQCGHSSAWKQFLEETWLKEAVIVSDFFEKLEVMNNDANTTLLMREQTLHFLAINVSPYLTSLNTHRPVDLLLDNQVDLSMPPVPKSAFNRDLKNSNLPCYEIAQSGPQVSTDSIPNSMLLAYQKICLLLMQRIALAKSIETPDFFIQLINDINDVVKEPNNSLDLCAYLINYILNDELKLNAKQTAEFAALTKIDKDIITINNHSKRLLQDFPELFNLCKIMMAAYQELCLTLLRSLKLDEVKLKSAKIFSERTRTTDYLALEVIQSKSDLPQDIWIKLAALLVCSEQLGDAKKATLTALMSECSLSISRSSFKI